MLFTNSGTEAGMLAVKIARAVTGRSLILKARGGYHGTYSDLEAGLHGQGEIPGHTLLAEFNDIDSFERVLAHMGADRGGRAGAGHVHRRRHAGAAGLPEAGREARAPRMARSSFSTIA